MKINEIFNTEVHINWQQHGRFALGGLKFNDDEYIVQVENKQLLFNELNQSKTAEVSFFKNTKDTEKAHSTTGEVGQPFKLYGAVANSLKDKFQNYEAFYFVAERRHSNDNDQFQTKQNIYQFLADRLSKMVGAKVYKQITNSRCEWLVSKVDINEDGFVIESTESLDQFIASGINFSTIK